jgi:hypothetical protein
MDHRANQAPAQVEALMLGSGTCGGGRTQTQGTSREHMKALIKYKNCSENVIVLVATNA